MTSVLDPEPWIKCWEICRGCHKGSEVTTEGLCIYMDGHFLGGKLVNEKGKVVQLGGEEATTSNNNMDMKRISTNLQI